MRVRCKANKPEASRGTDRFLGKGTGSNRSTYPLTIGKDYIVYGIARIGNHSIYLLLDDDQGGDRYPLDEENLEPVWYDAELFEVIDAAIDPTWGKMKGTMWTRRGETTSFPEFVKEGRGFYEDLIEGRSSALKIFLSYVHKYN